MNEEPLLFETKESYNLVGLRESCLSFIKKKYPYPVDGEDLDEFNEFIQQEADLEFCDRMRKMADQIEERILNPLKKKVKDTYKGYFK